MSCSFSDAELTGLADEIRKDLLTQPDLHPNDSFAIAFKLKIDLVNSNDKHKQKEFEHNPYPSWSYLSLTNTADDAHHIITPHTPDVITPYAITPDLLAIDSFPEIPSPKTSLNTMIINNGYSWVNAKSNPYQLSYVNSNISSVNSNSTVMSPKNQNQKLVVSSVPAPKTDTKHSKHSSKTILPPVLINKEQFKNNSNGQCNNECNMGYDFGDNGFVFINSD